MKKNILLLGFIALLMTGCLSKVLEGNMEAANNLTSVNTKIVPLENILGVNDELFESFERLITSERFTGGLPPSDYVFVVQLEALQVLDAMGVRDVNKWLDNNIVDTPESLIDKLNPKLRLDMETKALIQMLMAPSSTMMQPAHTY